MDECKEATKAVHDLIDAWRRGDMKTFSIVKHLTQPVAAFFLSLPTPQIAAPFLELVPHEKVFAGALALMIDLGDCLWELRGLQLPSEQRRDLDSHGFYSLSGWLSLP